MTIYTVFLDTFLYKTCFMGWYLIAMHFYKLQIPV